MKILMLGSGALKIGEAGEFDYSGSQAIKTFRRAGHEVILVNPNIATVQTDHEDFAPDDNRATRVYYLPVKPSFVRRIIEVERPDALALSFGGQTALNCGLELEEDGTLSEYKIRVLGTPVEVIRATEDREIFVQKLKEIDVHTPKSLPAVNWEQAEKNLEALPFPIIIRAGFALGGKGSGFCEDKEQFRAKVEEAFAFSPQILMEEDLRGWKEIEYEVVRDADDNCITVVNMENFDPLGIHTGESIVVSPSMTLGNFEYQMLRSVAIKTIRHLGIVGECNIQFALNPDDPAQYRVIEVNARLSRSSALASKATGYPLAAVAAEILLGKRLDEIPNAITKVTKAFFEPSLDYIALKMPRWDLQKFRKVSQEISTEMKSVGEVMALGRTFPECLQKAVRMLAIGSDGPLDSPAPFADKQEVEKNLVTASPRRVFAVAEGLYRGYFTLEEIHSLTKIDRWFLQQMQRITDMAHTLSSGNPDISTLAQAKQLGFSDVSIAHFTGQEKESIRARRTQEGIIPHAKQIDTLAAEFPAQTNYLYMTFHGQENDT